MHELRFPATYVQEQYLHATAADGASANLAIGVPLAGTLQRAALERALQCLVERHEALRTALVPNGRRVEQLVRPTRPQPLRERDLSASPSSQDALLAAIADDCNQPLSLLDGRPFRASLARLGGGQGAAILTVHHGLADAWSLRLLARDLARLYGACAHGTPSGLAPIRLRLGDYATWERAFRDEEREAHWRAQLAGIGGAEHWLGPIPMAGTPSWRARERLLATSDTLRSLRELARRQGTSLGTTLLAALTTACASQSEDDIVVGLVHANRDRPGLHALVGNLADIVPLRISPAGRASFAELVQHTHAVKAAAYAQRLPYGLVHRLMGNEGLWQRRRIVDVSFNYLPQRPGRSQQVAPAEIRLPRQMMQWRLRHDPYAPVCFGCSMRAEESGITGGYVADGRWLDSKTIDGLVQALGDAVERAASGDRAPARLV